MSVSYDEFLGGKTHLAGDYGFEPVVRHDFLFDFQASLVDWACRKGRGAVFADCGLGKTPIQLAWSDNVHRVVNKPVLIMTPLAVGPQTMAEAEKFGIPAVRSVGGKFDPGAGIVVTNYERLHYFDPSEFGGAVCDESSILKNFDGKTRSAITQFMRKLPYRLLCTATAAPNDFVELGTSSEALGALGYMDMLSKFFKNDQNSNHPNRMWAGGGKWRFRGHSQSDFWRWVCSWARACRKPSDLGFGDGKFKLPELEVRQHVVTTSVVRPGSFFAKTADTLQDQRRERRETLEERCDLAAGLINAHDESAVAWCHLNDESRALADKIRGAVEVRGSDSDQKKEQAFRDFQTGKVRVLVTKPSIAGFGLNWQHCSHQTFFPSHSFEQWYQAVRRSWRFGQTRPVRVDVVTSQAESKVLANLNRKAKAAGEMFDSLIQFMNDEKGLLRPNPYTNKEEVPAWV